MALYIGRSLSAYAVLIFSFLLYSLLNPISNMSAIKNVAVVGVSLNIRPITLGNLLKSAREVET